MTCFEAWSKNKCRHYSISHKKSYSILNVAKLFDTRITFLPERKGERYASALAYLSLSNKISRYFGKIDLKDYIQNFCKNHKI